MHQQPTTHEPFTTNQREPQQMTQSHLANKRSTRHVPDGGIKTKRLKRKRGGKAGCRGGEGEREKEENIETKEKEIWEIGKRNYV